MVYRELNSIDRPENSRGFGLDELVGVEEAESDDDDRIRSRWVRSRHLLPPIFYRFKSLEIINHLR